jgi:N-acyl-D-aspartate/D-glutamate deacylase
LGETYDVLITGCKVIDGSGRPGFSADVAIKDDRIAAVGDLKEAAAKLRIACPAGAVVAPGFIDVHNHAEGTILSYPEAQSFLMQGITTALTGHCGFSPAPLVDKYLFSFWEWNFWPEVEPYKYHEPLIHPLDRVRAAAKAKIGLDIDWHGFGEWMDRVQTNGSSLNIVPLVGHNTVRAQVMGNDHGRTPDAAELARMADLIRQSMDEGAVGFSTGLDYEPGANAHTPELVEMARVVQRYGGLHAIHWRRTGIRRGDAKRTGPQNKLAGIEEGMEISRQSGIKVLVAHIQSGYATYPPATEAMERAAAEATLEVIDRAIADGVDAAFDIIPNVDGGVLLAPHLVTPLAPWLRELGSLDGLRRALSMRDFRSEIKATLEAGKWYSFQPKADPAWAERIRFLRAADDSLNGSTLAEVARRRGHDPMETLFDLICEDPLADVRFGGGMSAAGVKTFYAHPRAMMGSDTFAFDDTWKGHHPPYFLPHPNTYSAVATYLDRFAPQPLEAAIHKLTGLPAAWLGIKDRGSISAGAFADVVVFDPGKYAARGDYIEPRRYPAGLQHVFVNGHHVVEDGQHRGVRSGRVLRRG